MKYCIVIIMLFSSQLCFGQNCSAKRFLVKETSEYFQFAPSFKYGNDSLINLIKLNLSSKEILVGDIGENEVLVILEIDAAGSVKSIITLVEDEMKANLSKQLQFFTKEKDQWCPGYYYSKKNGGKEIRKTADFKINIEVQDGFFENATVLYY